MVALGNTAADVRTPDLLSGRYLAIASVAFDVHLSETFVPIALGMPLLSAPRSQLLENLPFYVKSFGITHLGIVPSLIEATLNAATGNDAGTDMVLRYIASGGEKMSDAILDKWADHPQVRLANFYGPSEATIGCCARFMDPETPRANIGRTFANTAGYVVDANLNILPRGGIGELVVEGPLVGRGYHGRPDLTEKVFLEWPRKGERAYRTGDLVRMMPDSTIEILGRIDSQIKLRGVRIESEGISSIIRKAAPSSSDLSLDAATILGKHPSIGTEQLVSFVTWDPSVSIATRKFQKPTVVSPPAGLMGQIQQICEVELARYMRPSHIIPLSWLPLSSNGKSDIKLLSGIFTALDLDSLANLAGLHQKKTETRPATKTEEAVFTILGRHTTIPLSVALPDLNIFACGLDSMAVIQFAKDLHNKFGHKVPPSDIMSAPTLAGISSLLDDNSSSPASGIALSYTSEFSSKWSDTVRSTYATGSVECILPPFGVQEGVLARSADSHTMYVQHVIFACKDGPTTSGLRRAWEAIMGRSLFVMQRTVFFFGNELAQIVLNTNQLVLPWVEEQTDIKEEKVFVNWFLDTRAPIIARNINANLSESPAFRLSSFVSKGKPFLVFSIHHALYDGISLPLLFQDVEKEYRGCAPQAVAHFPDILDRIASIDLTKAREFWTDHFRGFVWPQEIPAQPTAAPTFHSVSQFRSKLSSLKELSASQNVTLQTVLTSAFAILAATRIYSATDIPFGIIRSGRLLPIDNVENAICPMVSVVPTRVNFGEPGNILNNIQSRASAMVGMEHVPLGKVQSWVRPGKALFDLLFSVSVKTEEVENGIWDMVENRFPEADYPLSVEVVLDPQQDTISIQAAWKHGALDEFVIRKLLGDFESIVLDIGTGHILSHLSAMPPSTAKNFGTVEGISEADDGIVSDPELLQGLRGAISEFLSINEGLLSDDISFIAVGLDSIKSVGLARRLKKLGHDIRAEEVMKYASLRMLTNRLVSGRVTYDNFSGHTAFSSTVAKIRSSFSADDLKLSSTDEVIVFPTTSLQAGMLTQTMSSKGCMYVHAFPLKIVSGVKIDDLEKAWMQVIDMLDILRTSFHFSSELGLWVQAVHSTTTTRLSKDCFTTKEDYEHKLAAYITSIKPTKESDLLKPPIWLRAFVPSPTSSEAASRLVFVMHHSLYDGLSVGALLDAVQSKYFHPTKTSLMPAPQFHTLLRHILDQEEAGVLFWIQSLSGFHATALPLRAEKRHYPTSHVASETFSCDPALLDLALRRSAVTVQCIGQAVWGKLMVELSGSTDVVFGQTVSGRSIPDAEDVIGPVLNTIPCRVHLQDGLRNIDLLRSLHKFNVDALPWQHTSLRSIQRKLGVSRLWESLFLFQPRMSGITAEPLWSFETQEDEEAQIQYAFAFELHQSDSGFMLKAACRPEYMDGVELKALLSRFQKLLKNLVSHLDSPALDDVLVKVSKAEQFSPVPVPNHAQAQEVPILARVQSLLTAITSIPPTSFTSITPLASLGIDSITAIQIVSQFRRAGLALNTNDIITSHTVGEMVAKIRPWVDNILKQQSVQTLHISPDEKAAIISRIRSSSSSIEDILPTSPGMKWLIGSWQRSGRTSFHHAFAFKLSSEVNISKLHEAWKSLLVHLPLLRSTFACASGDRDPRIVTFKPDSFPDTWSVVQAPNDEGLELVVTRMKEIVSSPTSTEFPPTRAILCQSSEADYLILYLHHFQYDAWCLPLILDDLCRLYLDSRPASSNDIRSFLQVSGPSEQNQMQQKIYWQSSLGKNFVPILFPSLLTEYPERHTRTIYTLSAAISKASVCGDQAQLLGVSLSSVFLACWAKVQSTYTASTSAILGLWQAGRSGLLDDISQLASPCLNIVPMRIPVPEGGATLDIVKGVTDDLRARSPIITQSNLVDVNSWVGADGSPLFNVVVNIIRVAPETSTKEGLLEQVKLPFSVPSTVPKELNPTIDRLAITDLIQVTSRISRRVETYGAVYRTM
ncbi:NRPS [Tephrocybe sp. NHM501043]|nr:NRPS [Tephrocybe sp. NHM501043]